VGECDGFDLLHSLGDGVVREELFCLRNLGFDFEFWMVLRKVECRDGERNNEYPSEESIEDAFFCENDKSSKNHPYEDF